MVNLKDIPNIRETDGKDGFKCTWNGISSNKIEDLQKGTCRCKQ